MDIKTFKQRLLDELYEPYRSCQECPLGAQGRSSIVFGEGNPDARLMIIGEGPGQQEDTLGRPFVGRSGQLLTKTLEKHGITRSTIFITNIVKCRPPNNRTPTPEEASTCKDLLLLKQIKIIRPDIICTLGSPATKGLLGDNIKISIVRGKKTLWENTIVIPIYHPAYILRNPREYDTFSQDLLNAILIAKEKM